MLKKDPARFDVSLMDCIYNETGFVIRVLYSLPYNSISFELNITSKKDRNNLTLTEFLNNFKKYLKDRFGLIHNKYDYYETKLTSRGSNTIKERLRVLYYNLSEEKANEVEMLLMLGGY